MGGGGRPHWWASPFAVDGYQRRWIKLPHARLLSKTVIGFVPMWRTREGDDAKLSASGGKRTFVDRSRWAWKSRDRPGDEIPRNRRR